MSLAALVPAKAFGRAKSRLSGALSPEERARLAQACFTRVVSALSASGHFAEVAVATDGEEVAALARELGCEVIADPPGGARFSLIIDAALAALAARGHTRALVVMADLPEATPGCFAPLLGHDHGVAPLGIVALAPDAEGLGTSALCLPLPAPFATAFGSRDSAARHETLAQAARLIFTRVAVPGLARDVDGPLDLVGRGALYR